MEKNAPMMSEIKIGSRFTSGADVCCCSCVPSRFIYVPLLLYVSYGYDFIIMKRSGSGVNQNMLIMLCCCLSYHVIRYRTASASLLKERSIVRSKVGSSQ